MPELEEMLESAGAGKEKEKETQDSQDSIEGAGIESIEEASGEGTEKESGNGKKPPLLIFAGIGVIMLVIMLVGIRFIATRAQKPHKKKTPVAAHRSSKSGLTRKNRRIARKPARLTGPKPIPVVQQQEQEKGRPEMTAGLPVRSHTYIKANSGTGSSFPIPTTVPPLPVVAQPQVPPKPRPKADLVVSDLWVKAVYGKGGEAYVAGKPIRKDMVIDLGGIVCRVVKVRNIGFTCKVIWPEGLPEGRRFVDVFYNYFD